MATNINIPVRNRTAQITYTTTISALSGGYTPQLVMPSGVNTWCCEYVLAGAGSLTIQQSCNDPAEVQDQRSSSGIPQVWVATKGTASTGGTAQYVNDVGCPMMLRGYVTGGSGSDILTICIAASYINA